MQASGIVAWSAAVTALTLQNDLYGVSSWLDGSWQVALDLAHRLHLPLGSDPVFTYGPYGFLDVRTPFFTQQWLEGVAFAVAVHVAFVALVALLLWRRRPHVGTWIAVGLTLLVTLPMIPYANLEGALLAAVLAYLAVDVSRARGRVIAAAAAGALLAVLLLDKQTAIVIVGGTLVVTAATLLAVRRWRAAGALVGSFVVAFGLLWMAAGLGAADVATFLRSAIELGSGYGTAMYYGSPSPEMYGGVVLLLIAAALAVTFALRRDAGRAVWFLLVLVVGVASFKDDFVRTGTDRYMLFYAFAAILMALSLVVAARGGRGRAALLRVTAPAAVTAVGVALLLTYFGARVYSLEDLPTRWASYGATARVVLSSGQRHALQDAELRVARLHYANWANNLHIPAGATVDVFPWDDALFYADPGLNWHPRPVLQSYTAYTAWLDDADARFLSGPSAPDYVVYSVQTIDDRYAVFDEPAAFRALLTHYAVVRPLDGVTVLLRRLPQAAAGSPATISRTCVPFGTRVAVPQRPDQWVFASVDVQPTLLGRTMALLYTPGGVDVTLSLPHGSTTRRLLTGVSADGLFVSSLINNEFDAVPAFDGLQRTPIRALTVTTANAATWASPVCVTFAGVAAPTTLPLPGS